MRRDEMDKKQQEQIDLQQIREKLSGESGGTYWKGLEEIAETPEYKQWLEDEFPNRSSIPDIDRRGFMKFVGASLALAGLSGCRNLPQEKLIPHVKAPEDLIPGKPVDYASAFVLGGYGHGILVQSNEGKPTKVEGNPDHPSSLGGTNIFALASILNL
ncbi:MAG TPA: TAT-variant-translocated molybdopterin oxidoreductase, partial [Fimbriimonadaceae bacterium]|nr:TAT-variant-translocated molybdopterin oxidoreductase [Fimbriimonadaceae bacterium]